MKRIKLRAPGTPRATLVRPLEHPKNNYLDEIPDEPGYRFTLRPDRPGTTSDRRRSKFGGPLKREDMDRLNPRIYNYESHPRMIYRMRLCGLDIDRIADIMGVDTTTLYKWRREHPEFAEAWLEGGEHADGKVANALFLTATGWQHDAEKIAIDSKEGTVTRVQYVEKFKPDVAAINMWLTNRQSDRWKNKNTNEVTGPGGAALAAPTIIVNPVISARQIAPTTIEGVTVDTRYLPDLSEDTT